MRGVGWAVLYWPGTWGWLVGSECVCDGCLHLLLTWWRRWMLQDRSVEDMAGGYPLSETVQLVLAFLHICGKVIHGLSTGVGGEERGPIHPGFDHGHHVEDASLHLHALVHVFGVGLEHGRRPPAPHLNLLVAEPQ